MKVILIGECAICGKTYTAHNPIMGTDFLPRRHKVNGETCWGSYDEVKNLRKIDSRDLRKKAALERKEGE